VNAASVRSTTIGISSRAKRPPDADASSTTVYRPSTMPAAVNRNDWRPAFFCSEKSVASGVPNGSRSVAVTVEARLSV
jgi:hypothetical protein